MPQNVIISVGGTGQMILHYYSCLYLIGYFRESFRALVVDTDNLIPSLDFLGRFFDDVRRALGRRGDSDVPSVDYLRLEAPEAGSVGELLSGRDLNSDAFIHPAQAFFSQDDLRQRIREGLFVRPALSSLLRMQPLWEHLRHIPTGSKICIAGSCVGGTGAGLILPIRDCLEEVPGGSFSIRAVILGQFFQPGPGKTVDIDRVRSNEAVFRLALQNATTSFDYYATPGVAPLEADRLPPKEMRHSPWPGPEDARDPYWAGSMAVDQVLQENKRDKKSPEPLQITPVEPARAVELAEAAMARVRQFIHHRILNQIGMEAFPERVWQGLARTLITYSHGLGWDPVEFGRSLQDELQSRWAPVKPTDYGLSDVFPNPSKPPAVRPLDIIGCAWPEKPNDVSRDTIRSSDTAKQSVSALMLYTLLRGGSAA